MRKTFEKEVKPVEKEVVNEFTLEEAFVLWKNKSKAGNDYLKGHTSEACGNQNIVGFFNTNKKNPKEPDVRIYLIDAEGNQDKEVADLWESISEGKGTRYLTGTTEDKEKLVAFYGQDSQEKRPYIRAYFKEDK